MGRRNTEVIDTAHTGDVAPGSVRGGDHPPSRVGVERRTDRSRTLRQEAQASRGRPVVATVMRGDDAYLVYVRAHEHARAGGQLQAAGAAEPLHCDACQYALVLAAYDAKVGRMRSEAEFDERLRTSKLRHRWLQGRGV